MINRALKIGRRWVEGMQWNIIILYSTIFIIVQSPGDTSPTFFVILQCINEPSLLGSSKYFHNALQIRDIVFFYECDFNDKYCWTTSNNHQFWHFFLSLNNIDLREKDNEKYEEKYQHSENFNHQPPIVRHWLKVFQYFRVSSFDVEFRVFYVTIYPEIATDEHEFKSMYNYCDNNIKVIEE